MPVPHVVVLSMAALLFPVAASPTHAPGASSAPTSPSTTAASSHGMPTGTAPDASLEADPTPSAAVRLASTAPAQQRADASRPRRVPAWNPNVRCMATVTSVRGVLGTARNANGGATFRGGGFRPGIPDRRAFRPPCFVHGKPTFVQINRVKMGACSAINDDGDWTCELTDPSVPRRRPSTMTQIHVETDQKFRAARGWSRPPGGVLINVQGFVFWDPGHTGAAWHHYSGWEIHSLTGWRRSKAR